MEEFKEIFLSWRPGSGKERRIVGVLRREADGKHIFSYLRDGVEQAKKEGFSSYTEFPDTTQSYNGTVLEVFAQRLMRPERTDIQTFYDFWEIEPQFASDKFYLLAHTQGMVPTDNFEFLADYLPAKGLHFLTDLANVPDHNLPAGTLSKGDELTYLLEAQNSHDEHAVRVFKGTTEIGYIKKIHCRIFHKVPHGALKLTVKALDQNGVIKKVFVKVELR